MGPEANGLPAPLFHSPTMPKPPCRRRSGFGIASCSWGCCDRWTPPARSGDLPLPLRFQFGWLTDGLHDFAPWETVYGHFAAWSKEGIFDQLSGLLRRLVREAEGRNTEPSACVLDAQSI